MDNNEKLIGVVAKLFRVAPETVNDASSPGTIRRWDSFGTIRLVDDLEKCFGVRFETLEVQDLKSVGAIRSCLAKKGISFP